MIESSKRTLGLALQPVHAIALLLAVLLSSCFSDGPDVQTEEPTEIRYANWSDEAEYVGREVCQTCHADKYDSFVRSQMGRSWKIATAELSVADFEHPEPVYSETDDLYYQPFRSGNEIFVREYRLEGKDTTHVRVQQINYIVGSGQHTNSHIFDSNGYLYQIPVTWYVQESKWGLAPGFESGNSRFSRPITEQCMTCHNGYSEFEPGSENRFKTVAGGIGCERCHGPGSLHIAAIKAGDVVDITTQIDYNIVNPAKLNPSRELDLCKRCHMQGADVFSETDGVGSFRPGQRLTESVNVFWPRQPDSIEVFNMASHPDRLAMSACFQASWEEDADFAPITCTTCHDPHVPIEETGPKLYNATCQSCHEKKEVRPCLEPSVAAGLNTATCASCHMPQSSTQDIPHVRITDHFIRVVNVPETLSLKEIEERKRFIRMASLVSKSPSDHLIADGLLTYFELITNRPGILDSAKVYLSRAARKNDAPELTESYIRLWYLDESYPEIRRFVRANPDQKYFEAWSHLRIGEAFAANREFGIALSYLEAAVERAPGFLRFKDRLASVHSEVGNTDRALELFRQITEANPLFEYAIVNMGYARLLSGDFDAAEADFLKAIGLYPDAEVALGNLATLYATTGRIAEASLVLNTLLKLVPDNIRYQQMAAALRDQN